MKDLTFLSFLVAADSPQSWEGISSSRTGRTWDPMGSPMAFQWSRGIEASQVRGCLKNDMYILYYIYILCIYIYIWIYYDIFGILTSYPPLNFQKKLRFWTIKLQQLVSLFNFIGIYTQFPCPKKASILLAKGSAPSCRMLVLRLVWIYGTGPGALGLRRVVEAHRW